MKPFLRYLLFQIPGWVTVGAVMGLLHGSAGVSARLGAGVVVFMMALDLALYPFFRHAYTSRAVTGVETLIGEKGLVLRELAPEGYVRVRAVRWKARLLLANQTAAEGETVEVMGIRGLTLLVRRLQ